MQETAIERIQVVDGEIALRRWGSPDRPTLLLVHGYPDSSLVWESLAEILSDRYHVVAYDVRGCGESSVPGSRRRYGLDNLIDDMAHVIDTVSPREPVHLIGHDWGAIQGWHGATAERLNGRIASFTSIAGPCLDHAGFWLRRLQDKREPAARRQLVSQALRSWYIGFFHLPAVAPMAWRLGFDRLWPAFLSRAEGLAPRAPDPNQCKGGCNGINLYRENIRPRLRFPAERYAHAPVLLIIPTRDRFISPELYDGLDRWVPRLTRQEVEAGHWVILSHPEAVAEHIDRFIHTAHLDERRPS